MIIIIQYYIFFRLLSYIHPIHQTVSKSSNFLLICGVISRCNNPPLEHFYNLTYYMDVLLNLFYKTFMKEIYIVNTVPNSFKPASDAIL